MSGAIPNIEVTIDDPQWRRSLPDAAPHCRRAAAAALALAEPRADGELSILLTGNRTAAALNQRYRGRPGPTNVLAFPAAAPPGAPRLFGDIVLARETVQNEAHNANLPLSHHMCHLIVHGTLHLLGHDHREDREAEHMQSLETRALQSLGIPDPWRTRP